MKNLKNYLTKNLLLNMIAHTKNLLVARLTFPRLRTFSLCCFGHSFRLFLSRTILVYLLETRAVIQKPITRYLSLFKKDNKTTFPQKNWVSWNMTKTRLHTIRHWQEFLKIWIYLLLQRKTYFVFIMETSDPDHWLFLIDFFWWSIILKNRKIWLIVW